MGGRGGDSVVFEFFPLIHKNKTIHCFVTEGTLVPPMCHFDVWHPNIGAISEALSCFKQGVVSCRQEGPDSPNPLSS